MDHSLKGGTSSGRWSRLVALLKGGRTPMQECPGLRVASRSDPGCCRINNEDNWICRMPEEAEERETKGVLALVADGMGGHAAGEVASSRAAAVIVHSLYESDAEPSEALRAAFAEANHRIFKEAQTHASLHHMGTTCTALLLRGCDGYYAHVGDSRLYHWRRQGLVRITEDHSEVMELVRCGRMNEEQARKSPRRNVILRALGIHPEVQVDAGALPHPPQPGDRFLLCSDGLHDLFRDSEIESALAAREAQDVCDFFVEEAYRRGCPDNITVGVIEVLRSPK